MIPNFPEFKKLDISDKNDIECITKNYPPYSDYNFVSIFSWDIDHTTELSIFNNNLVIKFQDYITKDIFYTFLGKNNINETVLKLISNAKVLGVDATLRLIPEPTIKELKSPNPFKIVEDVDNHDYILSVSDLIHLKGKQWRGKKNFVNRFHLTHSGKSRVDILHTEDIQIKKQIMDVFRIWRVNSNKSIRETNNEKRAIEKLLKYSTALNVRAVGVFVENTLIAFSINEVSWDKFGVIHYEKADSSYIGIFQYLKQQSAIDLDEQGCKYINYEQDLGIEGLRKAKQAHHPIKFLKKYTICLK